MTGKAPQSSTGASEGSLHTLPSQTPRLRSNQTRNGLEPTRGRRPVPIRARATTAPGNRLRRVRQTSQRSRWVQTSSAATGSSAPRPHGPATHSSQGRTSGSLPGTLASSTPPPRARGSSRGASRSRPGGASGLPLCLPWDPVMVRLVRSVVHRPNDLLTAVLHPSRGGCGGIRGATRFPGRHRPSGARASQRRRNPRVTYPQG